MFLSSEKALLNALSVSEQAWRIKKQKELLGQIGRKTLFEKSLKIAKEDLHFYV